MAEIKLLALDLDGTLTNRDKKVSEKNKEYIRRAQEKGVEIVLASGRPVIGIEKVADELDLWNVGGYILAYNGGQIIDCKNKTDLLKEMIPMKFYHDICGIGKRFNVFPLTYNDAGVICESDNEKYVLKEAYNNSIPVIKVDDLEKTADSPVVKFMVVGEPEELQKAYWFLRETFEGKLNVFFSEPYFLEITPLGIEKAKALSDLLNILGIKREALMACGDGLNDIPMLKYAGVAVAMRNAYDETKEYADFISKSNEEDGVAYAIEKYICKVF